MTTLLEKANRAQQERKAAIAAEAAGDMIARADLRNPVTPDMMSDPRNANTRAMVNAGGRDPSADEYNPSPQAVRVYDAYARVREAGERVMARRDELRKQQKSDLSPQFQAGDNEFTHQTPTTDKKASSSPGSTVSGVALSLTAGDAKNLAMAQSAKHLVAQGGRSASGFAKAELAVAKATPAMMAVSGIVAGQAAVQGVLDAGGSKTAATVAGGAAAAPMVAAVAAPSLLKTHAPKVAGALAKAAIPLTVGVAVASAGVKGYAAYKDGASAGAIATAASLGAADSLTFGLASMTYDGRLAKMTQDVAAKAAPAAAKVGAFLNPAAETKAATAKPTAAKPQMAHADTEAAGRPANDRSSYTTKDNRTVEATAAQAKAWGARRQD